MVGEVVTSSLKDNAWAVDWVKSGNDACVGFSTWQYDVILLDLGLPGKDGLTVLAEIRQKRFRCRCSF